MKNVSLPMKPSDYIKEGLWTVEEDRRLSDYIQSYGVSSWLSLPYIARLLRSGTSCHLRWLNHLNPPAERGNLTEEEQHLVIRLLVQFGVSPLDMALRLPGQSYFDIMNFWRKYTNNEVVRSVKNILENVRLPRISSDYIKEGLWTVEEDRRLSDYIQGHGVRSWLHLPDIAGLFRSGTSCRLRWLNYLNPAAEKGDLTEEEQHLVIRLIVYFGVSCLDIADRLPGKTYGDITNFWRNYCNIYTLEKVRRLPTISSDYIKEGLWAVEEDRRLSDYIQSRGVRSWLHLPEKAGLLRSGTSCHLRWLNHLNPAAERGDLTEEEQHLVIRLIVEFGKSCSGIAYSLPGKTYDDIWIFWTNYIDSMVVQKTKAIFNAQMLNDEDETQNERDATCIEQNDTNVGQPYSITIPPTPQDDLHSENKGVVQVDSSENNDTKPNESDYDDDDQNNNKTSLDTTHMSKTPGYITSKICFSLEVLEQHFDMNMEDAAKSLNVSRSSLKRMCRENGIERWPCRKRRKINHQQCADPKNVINKLVQKNNDQINKSTMTQVKIVSPLENASSSSVIIKATYGDDIIKFRLSISSGVDELREKIGKRVELEVRSFKLKYRDDAGDLVLITCDEDLHDCLGNSRLSTSIDNKTTFDILVINNSG